MSTVSLVVAIGDNGVIGLNGDMPWPRTGDQVQFKQLTMGHPMIMGRTTFESIGRPLPGRTSIVLTRDPNWEFDGVETAGDLEQALEIASDLDDEVFIIGGAQVYAAAIEADVVDKLVVTHVHLSPEGDAWFPETDWSSWHKVHEEQHDGYDIATYEKR